MKAQLKNKKASQNKSAYGLLTVVYLGKLVFMVGLTIVSLKLRL